MCVKRTDRRTEYIWRGMFLLTSVILVSTASSDIQDCGDGNITVSFEGDCTNYTCVGECVNKDTCCLEKCFEGDRPSAQDLDGCETQPGTSDSCSFFRNQTDCLADNLNKTFAVCWKHTIYLIASHPDAGRIKGFNPVQCPCDTGFTRKTGTCTFNQCFNSPSCEQQRDDILGTDVCCLHNNIFPQVKDCDEDEKIDNSVHTFLNASTIADCQELCPGGQCKMPDPTRFPACCKKVQGKKEDEGGDSLHGGIIALIVIICVVLTLCTFCGVFCLYRMKRIEAVPRKARNGGSAIEVIGLEEVIEKERDPKVDDTLYPDSLSHDTKNHVTLPDSGARVHSGDKLENKNVHIYENPGFSGDSDSFEGDCSSSPHRQRRRTTSTCSKEVETNLDDVQYNLDDETDDTSDDIFKYECDDDIIPTPQEKDQ